MYEYIKGSIASLSHTAVVVETSGIGYLMNISLTTHAALEGLSQATLYTHLYIVQDSAPVFYGFATRQERELFRLLISVNGIGAGTARIMLSSSSPEEIATMISAANVAQLTRVKGIGPKTAEMVVLKLRDKVLRVIGMEGDVEGQIDRSERIERWNEALDALLVLGFSRGATEKIVKKIATENPEMPTEDIIRTALAQL
ncbi:MAG: Holliday junction branch migration protein RuvA [Mucinivorans sp.]